MVFLCWLDRSRNVHHNLENWNMSNISNKMNGRSRILHFFCWKTRNIFANSRKDFELKDHLVLWVMKFSAIFCKMNGRSRVFTFFAEKLEIFFHIYYAKVLSWKIIQYPGLWSFQQSKGEKIMFLTKWMPDDMFFAEKIEIFSISTVRGSSSLTK